MKKDRRHTNRVRNLVILIALTAVIISVSTYAWFIGMRTVNVSSFDVKISSTDSLLLSLDGKSWGTTVDISKETFNPPEYTNNTNTWGGERGLTPVSTVGDMDTAASRLILFEKASLTATTGGYRLMTSRVDNHTVPTNPEPTGYVAFDLFIKNFSGRKYIPELEILDEEAIYLSVDSEVKVTDRHVDVIDNGVKDTGIENSVRVAYAQIGRVAGTETDKDVIGAITCTDDSTNKVTGICRTAQIWEPNDTAHVDGAIKWYNTSCKSRNTSATGGADITKSSAYGSSCNPIIDGIAYPTYAINSVFGSDENVDVYDGKAFNNYEETTELTAYDYFTDTMKNYRGVNRPEFMRLAPNSITKVRIYIFIEGQDIDNYDFASIGKKITINFGFTKERFTEADIEYEGEDTNQGNGPGGADLTPPRIQLVGPEIVEVLKDGTYTEQGATATDTNPLETDLTSKIIISGTVDTTVLGTYTVTYKVTDFVGNVATMTRTVKVVETLTP